MNDASAAMAANEMASVERDQSDWYVTQDDITTVLTSLRVAVEQFRRDADQMRRIAEAIRRGEDVPMFADGEGGAVAADRLAEQFGRQAADADRIMETLGEYPSVRITFD